jgi:hypothetical protein
MLLRTSSDTRKKHVPADVFIALSAKKAYRNDRDGIQKFVLVSSRI